VDKQWAQVQNVYQRRADFDSQSRGYVSGAAKFEKSTLTEITEARASVGQIKLDPNKAPDDPAKLAEFQKRRTIFPRPFAIARGRRALPRSESDRQFS